MTPLPDKVPVEQRVHPIIDFVCAQYVHTSVKTEALRSVSDIGLAVINRNLVEGDNKAIVLAGVRAGLYTIQRIGKRPVVVDRETGEELR